VISVTSRVDHTVPAYVAVCFFQTEIDQGVKPKSRFRRLLPGASPPPPSPSTGSKRSRGGFPSSIHTIVTSGGGGRGGGGGGGGGPQGQGMQVDTNPSPLSATSAYMSPLNANDPLANPLNQPSPDEFSSAGLFGFGRTRRTRNQG